MYKILATLDGILIALMIVCNGLLAETVGNEQALLLIHLAGVLGTVVLLLVTKTKLQRLKGIPAHLYLGGVLGIFNVLFNNMSIGVLGATLTISLNLLGQLLASTVIDQMGLFGLPKRPLNSWKCVGMMVMFLGVLSMVIL